MTEMKIDGGDEQLDLKDFVMEKRENLALLSRKRRRLRGRLLIGGQMEKEGGRWTVQRRERKDKPLIGKKREKE